MQTNEYIMNSAVKNTSHLLIHVKIDMSMFGLLLDRKRMINLAGDAVRRLIRKSSDAAHNGNT